MSNSNPFIRIEMDGTLHGTSIKFADGVDVSCSAVAIEHQAKRLPTVSLTLTSVQMKATAAAAVFRLVHPITGQVMAVKRVEFADGTTWEAPPCSE